MKKVFTESSREDAKRQSDEWWVAQKGLRKISQTEVATGDQGPSLSDANRWAVTIRYERENSN
jgi:hypothetical protein